jgi:16S rRNA (cytosine1402-N4)-methyltransferase
MTGTAVHSATRTAGPTAVHVPVLLAEVIAALAPRPGGRYVDGTFGAGGYARAILEAAPDTHVFGIDRDPEAIGRGQALAAAFPGRLTLVEGRFGEMDRLVADAAPVDGVALDLGVSSPQIDTPDRGFSFRFDGPLDMRMGRDGPTAADVVNAMDEGDLADVIYHLGEERFSRRVARAIVERRAGVPFTRTTELADLVRSVVPKSRDGIDPATRTFQALRIHVNDELGEVDRGLAAAERLLAPGGRLCIVTFHSLEDRKAKEFLKRRSGMQSAPSRHLPGPSMSSPPPTFTLTRRKPLAPGDAECATNPRARSAKLRVGERTAAPPVREAA